MVPQPDSGPVSPLVEQNASQRAPRSACKIAWWWVGGAQRPRQGL